MADRCSRNIITHFISLTLILNGVTGKSCTKLSSCSCKLDSGFVVDLSSISNNDQTPYFQDVPKPGTDHNEAYSFNPCSGFTEGTGSCSNVTLCKISVSGPLEQYVSLGSQSTASFSVNGDVIDLHYTDATSGSSVVHISCDDGTLGKMEPKGTTGGLNEINLSTKLACETKPKLSVGSIILIGLLCIIFLYLVVGIVIQILVRKQRGVQAIPNYGFWSSVTGNIKTGVVYTVKCGRKGQQYDKI